MIAQNEFLTLLYWIKGHGLTPPNHVRDQELFLNPFDKKIYKGYQLKPHQRLKALWIPSKQGMDNMGIRCELRKPDLYVAYLTSGEELVIGTGVGESEAILSCLNQRRLATVAQC